MTSVLMGSYMLLIKRQFRAKNMCLKNMKIASFPIFLISEILLDPFSTRFFILGKFSSFPTMPIVLCNSHYCNGAFAPFANQILLNSDSNEIPFANGANAPLP